MRSRDRDDDARLADLDAAHAMMDRNLAQLVSRDELRREVGHDLLGHALVGLVLEMEDVAPTRVRTRCPDERRDSAGGVVAHLRDGGLDGQRIGRESEIAAGHRRNHCDLVSGRERLAPLDVRAVPRVQKSPRLFAQPECRPHVGDGCAVFDVDLDGPGSRALPQRSEQSDAYDHASQGIRRLPCGP